MQSWIVCMGYRQWLNCSKDGGHCLHSCGQARPTSTGQLIASHCRLAMHEHTAVSGGSYTCSYFDFTAIQAPTLNGIIQLLKWCLCM